MHHDMPRWIKASVAYHFKTSYASGMQFFLEGEFREDQKTQKNILELRVDGPNFKEYQRDRYYIDVEINALLQIVKSPRDMFITERFIGQVAAGFTRCIPVYTYGDASNTYVGDLVLQTRGRRDKGVVISNFGQVNQTDALHQATIEGHYIMDYGE